MAQPTNQQEKWQTELRRSFSDLPQLLSYLGLPGQNQADKFDLNNNFPFLVTRCFANKIVKGDWNDPLLRQVLPLQAETKRFPGFDNDAVGDKEAIKFPGVLQKYRNRVLVTPTHNCPLHCRFCFRRNTFTTIKPLTRQQWPVLIAYLNNNPQIEEIILSGGEPLLKDNNWIRAFLILLSKCPHINNIRIHTRLPVSLPIRINAGFCDIIKKFKNSRQQLIMVIHTNHANELCTQTYKAILRLRNTGISIFNQTVLLKGINDNANTQISLNRKLLNMGVVPYYLHHPDKVAGTEHFHVSEKKGLEIIKQMEINLSGFGVPKYVKEVPGKKSKIRIL